MYNLFYYYIFKIIKIIKYIILLLNNNIKQSIIMTNT